MTLILPQLYMPSRAAGGGAAPALVVSDTANGNSLTLPGLAAAGQLCILTTYRGDSNISLNPSNFGAGADFSLVAGHTEASGFRGAIGQIEYRVLTSSDISVGEITFGVSNAAAIAWFYDLSGLSVVGSGEVAGGFNTSSLSANFSSQSGPAFWVALGGGKASSDPSTAHSGFTPDENIYASFFQRRNRSIVKYEPSGAGPTGNISNSNSDEPIILGGYITMA